MTESRAESIRLMCPLFHGGEGGETPTSALQLFFCAIDLPFAKALNRLWHSQLPVSGRPQCRVAYAAEFDGLAYAVAIWTSPLARQLPQTAWVELNRLAIAPDAPRNTASRMLGWMARDLARRFPEAERLISYQDCKAHTGIIYRAAGWAPTALSGGGKGWSRSRYGSKEEQSAAPKQRWEKVIRGQTP